MPWKQPASADPSPDPLALARPELPSTTEAADGARPAAHDPRSGSPDGHRPPPRHGRARAPRQKPFVTDGPFVETRELLAG